MMRLIFAASLFLIMGLAQAPTSQPAPRIHAHNDYEHTRPLFEALDAGARSVEADVFLVQDQLLVAHEPKELRPERTLRSLYLDRLREQIHDHSGSVYGDGQSLILLIDIKSKHSTTYPAIREVLEDYKEMLTHYDGTKTIDGPITVVLSGDQPPRKVLTDETDRLVACDGAISDLKTNPPVNLVPWISGQWQKSFKWNGKGKMPDDERSKLKDLTQQAHAQGRTIRFWGGPDNPATWQELQSAGVDWINTDRLAEASQFLIASCRSGRPSKGSKPAQLVNVGRPQKPRRANSNG